MLPSHTTNEKWRDIPDWSEYQVSDIGRVRRAKGGIGARVGRIVKPYNALGYNYVSLWRDNKVTKIGVHRLVALAFLPASENGQYQVAHNDGDRTNNIPSNLRWATPVCNASDRDKHGTGAKGEENPVAILTEVQVLAIRAMRGMRHIDIAEIFGISRQHVGDILNGRRWGHI